MMKTGKIIFFTCVTTLFISLLCFTYYTFLTLSKQNKDFYHFRNAFNNSAQFKVNVDSVTKKVRLFNNFSQTHILSYSLFGNNWERYGKHLQDVAKEAAANKLYHNWTVRVYHDKYIMNKHLLKNLTRLYQNLELYNVSNVNGYGDLTNINGMIWRFLSLADASVEVTCLRDLDSVILERESDAVKVWLESGKLVHIMRDNPQHNIAILGGMWCYRNELNRSLGIEIAKICVNNSMHRDPIKQIEATYGDDQSLLIKYLWPLVHENAIIHDSYFCNRGLKGEPFPSKRNESGAFVGQFRSDKGRSAICPPVCRPKHHQDWEYC